jgi:hypothetical protein
MCHLKYVGCSCRKPTEEPYGIIIPHSQRRELEDNVGDGGGGGSGIRGNGVHGCGGKRKLLT